MQNVLSRFIELLMQRERKEGQIRSIHFFKKGLQNSLDKEYLELEDITRNIEDHANKLGKTDMEEFVKSLI